MTEEKTTGVDGQVSGEILDMLRELGQLPVHGIGQIQSRLLEGYRRLGTWALALFMLVVVGSSFITMAAVTIVTAGLAGGLLGLDLPVTVLSLILLLVVIRLVSGLSW